MNEHQTPLTPEQLAELTARLDKLEQEIEWTREMVEILEEHIENMKS